MCRKQTKVQLFQRSLDHFDSLFSLSDMVEALINRVKGEHMSSWIILIPLLHLLKGTSKPSQPVFNQITQSEQSWAGLQGLKLPHVQDRR